MSDKEKSKWNFQTNSKQYECCVVQMFGLKIFKLVWLCILRGFVRSHLNLILTNLETWELKTKT